MIVFGMLASGWHSDRIGSRFGHLLYSALLVAACFAVMAFARAPTILITGFLAMSFFWPALTLSTNLVATEIVPCRMVAVAVAVVNTLAQLGAFVVPIFWGISKDTSGSYHLGLTALPLLFVASAGITLRLRQQIKRKELPPSVEPVFA